jgi:hypothetical protein
MNACLTSRFLRVVLPCYLVAFAGFAAPAGWALQKEQKPEPSVSQQTPGAPVRDQTLRTYYSYDPRWAPFAEGFSEITAAAISPLLVVSSIGALRYFRAPAEQRNGLPWFCQPTAWGLGLALLGLCFLKDVIGTALPLPLKKPLDMLELFENKLSALVAGTLFVPIVAAEMLRVFGESGALWSIPSDIHVASMLPWISAGGVGKAFLVAAALFCFASVWLTSHTINVLVALCPIGIIDAILKGIKVGVLAVILVTSLIHPFLGAAFCGFLLILALCVAGYAFRFAVFGTVMAWDVLWIWRLHRGRDPREARAFASSGMDAVPVRALGRICSQGEGRAVFVYRPWLVLPRRTVALPGGTFILQRGLLSVSMLHQPSEVGEAIPLFEFLPRYRPHVESLAAHYKIGEIRDGVWVGGFKALWRWIRELTRPTPGARKTDSEADNPRALLMEGNSPARDGN